MRPLFSLAATLLILTLHGQDHPLSAFEHLIKKTWLVEGTWGNGSAYKQEVQFEFGLNKTIVIAKTKGYTNQKNTTFGDRNYGIRQFSPKDSTISFHEFDVFGGLTTGEVIIADRDISYVYEYGGVNLIEKWVFKGENTYELVIGKLEEGNVTEVYLTAGIVSKGE